MGIFDRFLGKKKEEPVVVLPVVTPVEPAKKPERKKKATLQDFGFSEQETDTLTKGKTKGIGTRTVAGLTSIKKTATKKPKAPLAAKPVIKKPKATPAPKAAIKKPKVPLADIVKPKKKAATAKKKAASEKSDYQIALEKAKATATAKGEPWVSVLSVELDMDNLSSGSFSLDWNDQFIVKLVRAGYKGTDTEIVDLWFQDICRNILQENFEQEQADPTNRFRE